MSAIGNTLAHCLSCELFSETESYRPSELQAGVTKGVEWIVESPEETLEKLQGRFVK